MMKNSILKRVAAVVMAGLGALAFAACTPAEKDNDSELSPGELIESGGGNISGGIHTGGDGSGNQTGSSGSGSTGGNQSSSSEGDNNANDKFEEVAPPVISNVPVAEAVKVTKASGHLESAYLEWEAAENAVWYEVYIKPEGGAEVKLDDPLVRLYPTVYRADAVGLKAGKYTLKVVPVYADGTKKEDLGATVSDVTVTAHERYGFAFVNGTASGAYNEDGTLKSDAKVVYVTDENKDTVSVDLNTGKKEETFTGLQNILNALKKTTSPVDFRLIGKINSPAIDGKNNTDHDTVLVKENKGGVTIEGIGNDATAYGWTLRLVRASNVEVRNIGFMSTAAAEPDDVTLEKDDHVWVHNCDFFYGGAGGDKDQAKGDGALDTKESTNITHSYNHFHDTGKSNLQNMKEKKGPYQITYHHNWYDHSDSRHPRIRTATVHIFNNYFDGNAKYGVGVTLGASAFVENNYFRSTATMYPMLSSEQGTDALGAGTFSSEAGGMIKAYGNVFDGTYALLTQNNTDKNNLDCYLASSRDEVVPAEYVTKKGGTSYNNFDTASDMYKYEVDTPQVAKQKVEKYAGRIEGGDVKYTFDNEKEDKNYSIITELKQMLTNYKGTVLQIGRKES